MPFTLTIIADDADQLVNEFRKLNTLTTTPEPGSSSRLTALHEIPMDALIDAVRERLRDDGFKLEIIDQRDQNPPISPPETAPEAGPQIDEPPPLPEPKKKRAKANGAASEAVAAEPDAALDEDVTSPKKKAAKAPPAAVAPLDEPDPAGDRQHVLDTLAGILKDPKRKESVLAFASSMAQRHGKDKISELPVGPFPEIRRAMEKEFANA
jgi:hypothetical protein